MNHIYAAVILVLVLLIVYLSGDILFATVIGIALIAVAPDKLEIPDSATIDTSGNTTSYTPTYTPSKPAQNSAQRSAQKPAPRSGPNLLDDIPEKD